MENNCSHKWSGSSVMYSESGKRIDIATYLKWASYTDLYRQQVIIDYHEEICDPIVSVFSSCSKCDCEFNPYKHSNV